MADLALRHRLQPSLLERLTDEAPEQREEARETRGISDAQLRESVRRDLAALFNTTHIEASLDLREFAEVRRSILNYGIPDLAGRSLSSIDLEQLTQVLQRTIEVYEPRLLPGSLALRPHIDRTKHGRRAIVIDIEADLCSRHLPIALLLRSEIDLETGNVELEERDTPNT
jgi:type VI secretion system protein ImpF